MSETLCPKYKIFIEYSSIFLNMIHFGKNKTLWGVKKHLLKYALLLKCPPQTKGKELGKTQNRKVVDNFKTNPMVQFPPNSKLQEKRYAQNMKYSRNRFTFC